MVSIIYILQTQTLELTRAPTVSSYAVGETSVSIDSSSYVVVESAGYVDVVIVKSGEFPEIIQGTITTVKNGSADGT